MQAFAKTHLHQYGLLAAISAETLRRLDVACATVGFEEGALREDEGEFQEAEGGLAEDALCFSPGSRSRPSIKHLVELGERNSFACRAKCRRGRAASRRRLLA